jgi:hypothetical protein
MPRKLVISKGKLVLTEGLKASSRRRLCLSEPWLNLTTLRSFLGKRVTSGVTRNDLSGL